MRCAFIAMLMSIAAIPAVAETTRPSPDLAKENAELRAYVEKLEARIADLQAKLKTQQNQASPRAQIRPSIPAPYGYQLPAVPFQIPTPPPATPAPRLPDRGLTIPSLPNQSAPDTWRRHEFNGQEFYLIPLR